jgi:outer membrane immunogenic protein
MQRLRCPLLGIIPMRRLIVTAALAFSALPAIAADMAGPAPVLRGAYPTTTEAAVDFAGFYAGVLGGFNQQVFPSLDSYAPWATQNIPNTPYGIFGQADRVSFAPRTSLNGMGVGIFVGHNWSVDGYVLGLEADYTRAKLESKVSASRSGEFIDPTPLPTAPAGVLNQHRYTTTINSKTDVTDYGTIRARIGMPMGNFMPYLTGGMAWARTSYSVDGQLSGQVRNINTNALPAPGVPVTAYAADPNAPGPVNTGTGLKTIFGYAFGAGVDWALTSNIMVRAEVMTMRFDGWADGISKRSAAPGGLFNLSPGSSSPQNLMSINTARVGAAIKF